MPIRLLRVVGASRWAVGVATVDGQNPAPLGNHRKPFHCWYLQRNLHARVS